MDSSDVMLSYNYVYTKIREEILLYPNIGLRVGEGYHVTCGKMGDVSVRG